MKKIIIHSVLFAFMALAIFSTGITSQISDKSLNVSIPLSMAGDQTEIIFNEPLLLTSAGQSPEIQLAAVLAKRAGLKYQLAPLANANDLGEIRTLGLVVGASLKGLGAAGIDMNKEKARVKGLLEEAVKKKIPVLFLHLGGDQRRGELTDALVAEYLPRAKLAVILKSADNDGLFTKICQEHKIPLAAVDKTAEVAEVLKNIFSK
jgi:hypothetical protein